MRRKTDWLFVGLIADAVALYYCFGCLLMSALGSHQAKDLFWYGLGTVVTGVSFKLIMDQF